MAFCSRPSQQPVDDRSCIDECPADSERRPKPVPVRFDEALKTLAGPMPFSQGPGRNRAQIDWPEMRICNAVRFFLSSKPASSALGKRGDTSRGSCPLRGDHRSFTGVPGISLAMQDGLAT